jgi:hypothetical protein
MISSRKRSRPLCTSVMSTFFLHAFLPFRDGCLNCCGAAFEIDISALAATRQFLKMCVNRCICEREAEKSDFGSRFRRPFHRAPGRFNLFLGPRRQACKVSLSLHGSCFRHTPPSPPLPSPSDQFWAPQALSPKWTSLDLLCGSWLAVYIGCCSHLAFVLRL